MGSWGYGNFDNDDAANFLSELENSIQKLLNKPLVELDYNGIRAASQIIIALSRYTHFDPKLEDSLLERMQVILNNYDWQKDWRDSRKIRSSLQKQFVNSRR